MNYYPDRFCEYVASSASHHMMPHYFLQIIIMGVPVMFSILVIGFLVIIDRARRTNIIRARESPEPTVEELFLRAVSQYERLNKN